MVSGLVSEIVSEIVSEMDSEMLSDMFPEIVSEQEMGSGMPPQSKLIDWDCLFRGDPRCLIDSSSPLFTVLFEMDVIADLEKC
jgi:hypothetical protein